MGYKVFCVGYFDTREEAEEAFNAMEDAVGKHNGELHDSNILSPEEQEEDE